MHIRFTEAIGKPTSADSDAMLDLTLIPSEGDVEGRRVEISTKQFSIQLRKLYSQLSRQESLETLNPESQFL